MLKKLQLLSMVILVFMMAFCQQEDLNNIPSDMNPIEKTSNIITIEDAEKELLDILIDLKKESTRSDGNTKSYTVSSRFSIGEPIKLRSSDNEEETEVEPYVHIFNFENEEGFAIMSGDDRVAPLLALTFNGNLEPDSEIENPALIMALSQIENHFELIKRDDKPVGGPSSNYTTTSAWSTTYYPMKNGPCPIKWGQQSPHNTYCFTTDKKAAYVGCTAVAVAQLMACYKYPASNNGYTYSWSNMTSYPYAGIYNIGATYTDQVARLMQKIGLSKNLNTTYGAIGSDGSSAATENIPRTLVNFGYSNGGKQSDYNTNTIVNELKNGYYATISGYAIKTVKKKKFLGITTKTTTTYSEGHAWLAEGLVRRYRTKNTYNSSGKFLSTSTEEYYYPLCNMGWSGSSDGYYLSGIFDTNAGRYARSEAEVASRGTSKNFQFHIQMVTGIRK